MYFLPCPIYSVDVCQPDYLYLSLFSGFFVHDFNDGIYDAAYKRTFSIWEKDDYRLYGNCRTLLFPVLSSCFRFSRIQGIRSLTQVAKRLDFSSMN